MSSPNAKRIKTLNAINKCGKHWGVPLNKSVSFLSLCVCVSVCVYPHVASIHIQTNIKKHIQPPGGAPTEPHYSYIPHLTAHICKLMSRTGDDGFSPLGSSFAIPASTARGYQAAPSTFTSLISCPRPQPHLAPMFSLDPAIHSLFAAVDSEGPVTMAMAIHE